MNADIRIYPAEELSALDMAELMDAALIVDGVLQGCGLFVQNNELYVTSGRIIIKGRLGVITGGMIERPSGVLSRQTCHICAVCDLVAENPFTIQNLKQGDYDELVSRASGYSDRTFNVDNGVAIYKIGTSVVDPSVGVVSATPVSYFSGKNADKFQTLVNTVNNNATAAQTNLNNAVTAINSTISGVRDSGSSTLSLATLNSWINYLKKRAHAVGKFEGQVKSSNQYSNIAIKVPANGSTTVNFRKEHDSRMYVVESGSGGSTASYAVIYIKPDGTIVFENAGTQPSYTPVYDRYGVPTSVNSVVWEPFGVLGISISGTNATNCVISSYGFSGNHIYVRIRNVGSTQASVNVAIKVLYIRSE